MTYTSKYDYLRRDSFIYYNYFISPFGPYGSARRRTFPIFFRTSDQLIHAYQRTKPNVFWTQNHETAQYYLRLFYVKKYKKQVNTGMLKRWGTEYRTDHPGWWFWYEFVEWDRPSRLWTQERIVYYARHYRTPPEQEPEDKTAHVIHPLYDYWEENKIQNEYDLLCEEIYTTIYLMGAENVAKLTDRPDLESYVEDRMVSEEDLFEIFEYLYIKGRADPRRIKGRNSNRLSEYTSLLDRIIVWVVRKYFLHIGKLVHRPFGIWHFIHKFYFTPMRYRGQLAEFYLDRKNFAHKPEFFGDGIITWFIHSHLNWKRFWIDFRARQRQRKAYIKINLFGRRRFRSLLALVYRGIVAYEIWTKTRSYKYTVAGGSLLVSILILSIFVVWVFMFIVVFFVPRQMQVMAYTMVYLVFHLLWMMFHFLCLKKNYVGRLFFLSALGISLSLFVDANFNEVLEAIDLYWMPFVNFLFSIVYGSGEADFSLTIEKTVPYVDELFYTYTDKPLLENDYWFSPSVWARRFAKF